MWVLGVHFDVYKIVYSRSVIADRMKLSNTSAKYE